MNEKIKQAHSYSNSTPDNTYLENLDFWNRAWSMVKAPYTQLPNLAYLPGIPQKLKQIGAKKILDLGCGSGWLSIYLNREGFQMTGVDISPQAIQLARSWAQQENTSIAFDVADISNLPYAPATFDAIVANSIFEHLTYELAFSTLKTLQKLLVPAGMMCGCFDLVGIGPGEYYQLADGTHVYTDKGRRGMLLHYFKDEELKSLFANWVIDSFESLPGGTRIIWACPSFP